MKQSYLLFFISMLSTKCVNHGYIPEFKTSTALGIILYHCSGLLFYTNGISWKPLTLCCQCSILYCFNSINFMVAFIFSLWFRFFVEFGVGIENKTNGCMIIVALHQTDLFNSICFLHDNCLLVNMILTSVVCFTCFQLI